MIVMPSGAFGTAGATGAAGTAGSQWSVLVSGEHTEGRFAVVETRERPGTEPPRHMHSREDELVFVLEGQVTFLRDDERIERTAQTWLLLPRGSEHTFVVQSTEARLLFVLLPAGLERSLGDLTRGTESIPDALVVERLVTTAARYGVTITGPQ